MEVLAAKDAPKLMEISDADNNDAELEKDDERLTAPLHGIIDDSIEDNGPTMKVLERKESISSYLSTRLGETAPFPETLYVIVFSPNAQSITVDWLTDMLQMKQEDGGAELLIRSTPASNKRGVVLYVSATPTRLLQAAELMEIQKPDKDGCMKEFTFQNLDDFLSHDAMIDTFLSMSEKQRVILHEIENLHVKEKCVLFGYPNVKLYPAQSIVNVCVKEKIIEQIFPLHEHEELAALWKKWSWYFKRQPLNDIRKYFGEAISFYFAFLEFYTWSLVPPAIFGTLQFFFYESMGVHCNIIFAMFNMIWITLFLKCWKRRSNELAYKWGTIETCTPDEPRPAFRGKWIGKDPVTGKQVPVYPIYKTWVKEYFVSVPAVLICMVGAFQVMLAYFVAEDYMIQYCQDSDELGCFLLVQMPAIVYALLIVVMNTAYRKLATWLTEWENHRTQSSHENHWIIKLVLFEFINNFMCVFYIAFYTQDMAKLKTQIAVLLIVYQLVGNIQEVVQPLVYKYKRNRIPPHSQTKLEKSKQNNHYIINGNGDKEIDTKEVLQAHEEINLMPYEGTYYDYLELFIQFGFVFLFCSIFPLAALCALLNNLIEMHSDAFKLCRAHQRPPARYTKGIGAWLKAFEVMAYLAVITNCALLSMLPAVRSFAPNLSGAEWALAMIVIEHIILGVELLISYLVPDNPKWVALAMKRTHYESRQILKQERRARTQGILRRLRTIYGIRANSVSHHSKKE